MAYKTPRELKKKYGKIAYVIYGLKQLRNKIHSYNIKYKVDGKEFEGRYSFIFITNSSRVAGVNDIYYDVFGLRLSWDEYKEPLYDLEIINQIQHILEFFL